MERGITESGITWKFYSGIRYNVLVERGITESGITESERKPVLHLRRARSTEQGKLLLSVTNQVLISTLFLSQSL